MLSTFFNWLFKQPSGLEAFILSKRPTNAAEVDYWTIQYNHTNKGAWL